MTSRRLVSFRARGVAAICYEVEALDGPMRVALQSNLLANGTDTLLANQTDNLKQGDPRGAADLGEVLVSRLSVHDGLRVVLAHTTRSSGLSLAAGMEHVIDAEHEPEVRTESEDDLGRVTISAQLTPGRPLRVVKLLAYHWSSQESIEWLRDQVDASLENSVAEGFDGLAESQRLYLDDFWAVADVELEGDPEIQQALRFALFNVLQASARAETRAIAGKGLTGPGYDGHAFWDTETFVLPILTYTRPAACTRCADLAPHHPGPGPRARAGAGACGERRSRGEPFTARSARATGRPARPPSTSTPTSRTPCGATCSRPATTTSSATTEPSCWSRRRACG